jgi:tetratricopeptide (TPR) repeat protein
MKKFVLASAMALAFVAYAATPALRAQDNSGQITIQDPAEFNAYQQASTQTDPAAKASALEGFLTAYPNSVVKKAVLDSLMDAYQALRQNDKALSAAKRLLQLDANYLKAIFVAVYIEKTACQTNIDAGTGESKDPQTCDDAGVLAQKGLTAPKTAGMADAAWKQMTDLAYPIFHSAIAADDVISKKDYAAAIKEYITELNFFSVAQTQTGQGLVDTLQLAQTYSKPGDTRDPVKAIWFYARAWDFAPPAYKAQIEPQLEYWYKRFHGTLDGDAAITQQISAIKTQAQSALFPPATYKVDPAPSPADLAHRAMEGDLTKLNLEDKEYILANGSKDDASKLWSALQGQLTPVPGVVISAPATVIKVSIPGATPTAKPKEYEVKLTNAVACSAVAAPPAAATGASAATYLQANGVAADVSAIADLDKAKKVILEPAVTVVNVAVTQDAKDTHSADFTVNLKEPLACKEAPAAGLEVKPSNEQGVEVYGTYSTYTITPAQGSTAAKAQIVLNDGGVQQQEKKGAPAHKPAAGAAAGAHKPPVKH